MEHYNNFKKWCNLNQGLLTFFGVVFAFIAVLPLNKIDFNVSNGAFSKVLIFLQYQVSIPVYVLIALLLLQSAYVFAIIYKYKKRKSLVSILEGRWTNRFILNGKTHDEPCEITKDGKYLVGGVHWFDIKDFSYDKSTGRITFVKAGVQPNDPRKYINELTFGNKDLLKGIENNSEITYTRR